MKKRQPLSASIEDLPARQPGKRIDPVQPAHPMPRPDDDAPDQEAGQPSHAAIPTLPEERRERLIDGMVERVSAWFRSRAEEVLEAPHEYGEDLNELRWQICGAVAEDLDHDYGEAIEEQIREAYEHAALGNENPDP